MERRIEEETNRRPQNTDFGEGIKPSKQCNCEYMWASVITAEQ